MANWFDLRGSNFTVDRPAPCRWCAADGRASFGPERATRRLVGGSRREYTAFCFLCFAKTYALSPRTDGRTRSTLRPMGSGLARCLPIVLSALAAERGRRLYLCSAEGNGQFQRWSQRAPTAAGAGGALVVPGASICRCRSVAWQRFPLIECIQPAHRRRSARMRSTQSPAS